MRTFCTDIGTSISRAYRGIYYLNGNKILFPTQVIVIKELEEENHASLRVLTRKPKKQDVNRFLEMFKNLEGKSQREYAESVLEVFTAANRKLDNHGGYRRKADEWLDLDFKEGGYGI